MCVRLRIDFGLKLSKCSHQALAVRTIWCAPEAELLALFFCEGTGKGGTPQNHLVPLGKIRGFAFKFHDCSETRHRVPVSLVPALLLPLGGKVGVLLHVDS